jgi:hypothetical protein
MSFSGRIPPPRRISIQNDASPIRNKSSPPDLPIAPKVGGIPIMEVIASGKSPELPVVLPLRKRSSTKETWVVGQKRGADAEDEIDRPAQKRKLETIDEESVVEGKAYHINEVAARSPVKTRSRARPKKCSEKKARVALIKPVAPPREEAVPPSTTVANKPKPKRKALSNELRSLLDSTANMRSRNSTKGGSIDSRRSSHDSNGGSKPSTRRVISSRNFGFLADPEKIMKRKK